MSYKLIALDMDGTLLNKNKEIPVENREWIAKALDAGKFVVLATGRPISFAASIAQELGLQSPLIINNGSEVWKSLDTLHIRHEIGADWIERIFEVLSPYGDTIKYWAHTVEGPINHSNRPADLASVRWLQFAIRSDDPDCLQQVNKELSSWNVFEISNSHPTNLEFNPIGITKASGLKEVCKMLAIPLSETIAVGDSLNDVPMLRAAGLGVAMGNAQDITKQNADVIAPSNEESGVAYVIRHYFV